MNQSDGGEHATRLAAIFPLRASQGGAMADIPTDSLPAVVGDDAYQKTLRELRADFAEQYEAWLLVAREALARPTMTGRRLSSVAEALEGGPVNQPAVDSEVITSQVGAVVALAGMCF
jgi:hypothetical protein